MLKVKCPVCKKTDDFDQCIRIHKSNKPGVVKVEFFCQNCWKKYWELFEIEEEVEKKFNVALKKRKAFLARKIGRIEDGRSNILSIS
jgi:C4-type Zn-finger protein